MLKYTDLQFILCLQNRQNKPLYLSAYTQSALYK